MKKITNIFMAAVLLLSAQSFGQGFTIDGKITGLNTGNLTLQERGGEKYTAEIKDGQFSIKGKVTDPSIHILRVDGLQGYSQLFVENTKMKFTANSDDLMAAKLTGSKSHDVLVKYIELNQALSAKHKPLSDSYSEARRSDNKAEMERIEKEFEKVKLEQLDITENFIRENNKSATSAYILASLANSYDDPYRLEEAINSLDKNLNNNKFVVSLKENLLVAKKTAIGQVAMDFTQNDVNDKPVKLSDFRGQVVLLDFWAAWCGPCRAENPNVVEAYKKFHDKGFTVLGVSLDRTKDKWLEAIEKDKLTWTHVSDLKYWDNAVAKMYGIRAIPANLLLDKEGRIIARNLREEDLHTKLAELLN